MIDGAAGTLTNEQKYNLAIVVNSGKRLSNMINDILDFTKLKNKEIVLQLKPVDLKIIADTILILSKPLIKGKDLRLVNKIDASFAPVAADENRMQQILYNLIGNAIKFTEKGEVSVYAEIRGNMAAVSVSDTGIGIAEDKFERIFESFEQADGATTREYGGTGLGLSITKKMVELHGGSVSLKSRLGEGSEFTFTVPLADESIKDVPGEAPKIIDIEAFAPGDKESSTEKRTEENPEEKDVRRILVVDDEPVNIQVLNNILIMRDYSVTSVYNGIDALEMIESGKEFDLVLLDIMMPKMSGYEVCRRIREQYSLFNLPVIMLTAKNQIQDVVLGFQSGANDYIQKPFDKEELLARIKTLLELKNATSAAMAANKAKGLFLSNMSHEIRTPLNAVIGLTNLLLKTHMDEKQKDYTDKMRRAASTMLSLVNDILDFAKIDTGDMAIEQVPFNIYRLIDDLAFFFQEKNTGSGVKLVFDLDPALPMNLLGDPRRLQQIFINLLDNAYKFTEKGSITVKAAVSSLSSGNAVVDFAVEDTGIGISKEQIDAIFAAFNQADNSATRKYGGVGIGLTVTRQIVELMGGKMSVSSEEGKGTLFSFSCPFLIDSKDSALNGLKGAIKDAEEGDDERNVVLRGSRILLVEDNEINAMIAAELLKAVNADITIAINGSEALRELDEAEKTYGARAFDIILMDLQMPIMDGYEATQKIKGSPLYRDIPIYALTAHAFPEDKERCFSLGMAGHLSKPIDVELFYATLRDAIIAENAVKDAKDEPGAQHAE
jgi:signal transduction histidine kinase